MSTENKEHKETKFKDGNLKGLRHKTAVIAITENGKSLALKLRSLMEDCDLYFNTSKNSTDNNGDHEQKINIHSELSENIKYIDIKFKDFVGDIFNVYESIVFIMATGIVVRSIAPYLESKLSDPAVIVMDERGKNIISLLSGHVGGANELTLKISKLICANPVITTATDVNEKASLDMIAKKLNAYIDNFRANVKEVNSLIVNNKSVGILINGDYKVDTSGFKVLDALRDNISYDLDKDLNKVVVITDKQSLKLDDTIDNEKVIKVVPKDIVVGIGCRKDTSSKFMFESLIDYLNLCNIDINSIAKIGSINIKKDETAIKDLADKLRVEFEVFDACEIGSVDFLYKKSEFVKKNVGVYSVSEPVAHLMSEGNLIYGKKKYKGITFALGRVKL